MKALNMKRPPLHLKPVDLRPTTLWWIARRLFLLTTGTVIVAFAYALFQVPFNVTGGGISGVGIIVNALTGLPVGLTFLLLNIPLLIVGFFTLGRWKFLLYTILSVIIFSFTADMFVYYLPTWIEGYPVTDDMLLSSIYAGLLAGIGNGLVYRSGGTMGGTNVIARLLQRKTGLPTGQVYLYIDGMVILAALLIFGWEIALHGLLLVFLMGLASDFAMEGPSTIRTATIVTDQPEALTAALMKGLKQGASHWDITGSYTGQTRAMVLCTVYRSQVNEMKRIVAMTDPAAFVVIGQAHRALGGGFMRLDKDD